MRICELLKFPVALSKNQHANFAIPVVNCERPTGQNPERTGTARVPIDFKRDPDTFSAAADLRLSPFP
jgi:hypothetical protein